MSRVYKRKAGLSTQDMLGIVLIALVFIAGGGIVYWKVAIASKQLQFDPETYCPSAGPFSRTALLVDLTDSITVFQKQKIVNYILSLTDSGGLDGVQKGEMLEVYLLDPDTEDQIPKPAVSVCNPGDGEGLSEFTNNPRLAKRRFTEKFANPVNAAIAEFVDTKPSNKSPLIETIRGIALTGFAQPPDTAHQHRLVIISDMLQHSDALSFYRDGQLTGLDDFEKYRADLDNVAQIKLFVLNRDNADHLQGKNLVTFWQRYFRESGSNLMAAERWAE